MSRKSNRYAPEFRRRMVELVKAGRTPADLAREFGPAAWTISYWVKQTDRDAGKGDGGLTTDERAELARLRREIRRLEEEKEILKKPRPGLRTRAL
jgi:transposase